MYQMIGRFTFDSDFKNNRAEVQSVSGVQILEEAYAIGVHYQDDLQWFNLIVLSGFVLVMRYIHYKTFSLAVASNKLNKL